MGPRGEVPCVPLCHGGPPTAGATASHSLQGVGARMEATLPRRPINPHIACLWSPKRSHNCALLQNKGSSGGRGTGREQGWARPQQQGTGGSAAAHVLLWSPQNKPLHPRQDPICRNPRRPESAVARAFPPEAHRPLLGGWRGSGSRPEPLSGDRLPGTLSWALWLRGRP